MAKTGHPAEAAVTQPLVIAPTPERLLATKVAAELIGFSDSFLEHDRLRTTPLVPFVKIGRAVRYRLSDLLAFMEEPAKAA